MQKKLLTVAIGAALAGAAFAASAEVTVYGRAQVEWAQVSNDLPVGGAAYPTTGLGTNNMNGTVAADSTRSGLVDNKMGRFGIKASEDLGAGFKGIANFEWQVDTSDNVDGTPITERTSYVGISHKAVGAVRLGQDHSSYKLSGVALDPFVATMLEARNNYGMSGNRDGYGVGNAHGGFWDNMLSFRSASWFGVYVNADVGLQRTGAETACGTAGTTGGGSNCDAGANGGKNNGDYSVVAGYKNNFGAFGLNIFVGQLKLKNTTGGAGAGDPTSTKFGAQFVIAKTQKISLQLENTDRARAANAASEAQYIFVGYNGGFGPVNVVVQWGGMVGDLNIAAGTERVGAYLGVGAIYNVSKTFRVFGGWRNSVAEDDLAVNNTRDDSVISIGLRKDF